MTLMVQFVLFMESYNIKAVQIIDCTFLWTFDDCSDIHLLLWYRVWPSCFHATPYMILYQFIAFFHGGQPGLAYWSGLYTQTFSLTNGIFYQSLRWNMLEMQKKMLQKMQRICKITFQSIFEEPGLRCSKVISSESEIISAVHDLKISQQHGKINF